jgi:hypothetical protein
LVAPPEVPSVRGVHDANGPTDVAELQPGRPSTENAVVGCTGGAKGSGAPYGPRNGAYRNGAHTNELTALRKVVAKFKP